MSNLLTKIQIFILRNKSAILFISFFALLFSVENSFAADTTPQGKVQELFSQIIALGDVAFALGGVLIGALTQFIGLFLQPGWTTGSVLGLDVYFKQLWILVSNMIYFIFAFILIVIAFMNIIGKGENAYQMKTALPHFIVGIIIVPFSWFIVQFVLSISTLLTVSALSLPWDMFGKSNTIIADLKVPTNCEIDIDKVFAGATASGANRAEMQRSAGFDCKKDSVKPLRDIMGSGDSLFSIMYVYSYGIMRIQDFDTLFSNQLNKGSSTMGSLVANVVFNAVFIMRFLILLIALAIAMFSRGVVLWLFTIFSPVFGLMYFFNGKTPESLKGLSKISFKDFIGVAMVPVYVGLALSFGLLFTFVATQGIASNGISTNNAGTQTSLNGNSLSVGGMNMTITGSMLGANASTDDSTGKKVILGIANGGAGLLRQLFVDLLALAVLWMAVMAALKSSTITGSVIQPIEQFGSSIGKTAMKLPQYAPIFPGGQSMQGMQQIGAMPGQAIERKIQDKAMNSDIAKMFNPRTEKANEYEKRRLQTIGNDPISKEKFIEDQIRKLGTNSTQQEKESFISALTNKNLGIDDKLLEGLRKNTLKENDFRNEIVKLGEELGKGGVTTSNNSFNTIREVQDLMSNTSSSDSPSKSGSSGGSTGSTNLPAGVEKKNDGIHITINNKNDVLKVDNGKIDNGKIDDLISKFDKKSTYSENGFKKILTDLGITDNEQQKKIWETLK